MINRGQPLVLAERSMERYTGKESFIRAETWAMIINMEQISAAYKNMEK